MADVARGAIVDETVIEAARARLTGLRVARVPSELCVSIHRENWESFLTQIKEFLREI